MPRFADIVFLQGDDATPVVDQLFQVEDGIVAHGITAESVAEVASYLSQFDNGDEPLEYRDDLGTGDGDVVIFVDGGQYVITADLRRNHVALYRIAA